jgi:hypothetical protein
VTIIELYQAAAAKRREAFATKDPEVAALLRIEATRLTAMAKQRKAALARLKQTHGLPLWPSLRV